MLYSIALAKRYKIMNMSKNELVINCAVGAIEHWGTDGTLSCPWFSAITEQLPKLPEGVNPLKLVEPVWNQLTTVQRVKVVVAA